MKVYTKLELRKQEVTGVLGHYSRLHGGECWRVLQDGSVAVIGSDGKLGIVEAGNYTLAPPK